MTTTYYVTLDLNTRPADPNEHVTADDLVAHVEDVLAALRDLDNVDGVYDVDCILTATSGQIEFAGYVDTDEGFDAAARLFSTRVRAAIHAAKGGTPVWDMPWERRGELTVGAPEPASA